MTVCQWYFNLLLQLSLMVGKEHFHMLIGHLYFLPCEFSIYLILVCLSLSMFIFIICL